MTRNQVRRLPVPLLPVDPFVARFFNERVFGPLRLSYLDKPVDQPVRSDVEAAAAGYARQLDQLDAANRNLLLSLQQMASTGDPDIDAQWRAQLQHQFADNTKRRPTCRGRTSSRT